MRTPPFVGDCTRRVDARSTRDPPRPRTRLATCQITGGGHTGSGYDALPTVRAFPGSHKSPDRADQPAAVHPASVTAGGEHDHALRLVNDLPMLGDARKRRLDLGLSLLTAHVGQVHEEALESLDLPGSVLDAVSHAEHRPDPLPSVDD